jgi:hypothetical protein
MRGKDVIVQRSSNLARLVQRDNRTIEIAAIDLGICEIYQ